MKIQRSFRPRLTFVNVVAMICLCVVVGGSEMPAAAAARLFGSADIRDNSLRSVDIRDQTITGADVKDKSLTADDFSGVLPGAMSGPDARGERGAQGLQVSTARRVSRESVAPRVSRVCRD